MKTIHHPALRRLALLTAFAFATISQAQAAVTWYWKAGTQPTDQAIKTRIAEAMNSMKGNYNAYSSLTFNIEVQYDATVPTANATYQGRIKFGGSRNDSTAHHETGHIFGVGTQSKWDPKVNSSKEWTGATAKAKYKSYEGETAVLKADNKHFWKYGMNSGWENPERHVKMVLALRSDMGL